jgi:single-strand DNA-binding protein
VWRRSSDAARAVRSCVTAQGFNSNLTVLDGRGGGVGYAEDAGGDFGAGGPAPRRTNAAGSRDSDMDDDIPF